MKLRINLDTDQANKVLTDLVRKGEDLSPLMADIAELLLHSTQDRFSSEQDPEGLPWEPLDPKTAKRKRELAANPNEGGRIDQGILKMRGPLFDTLGHDSTKSSASLGSQLIYAATHQFGDLSRGIPAREFLGISIIDEGDIIEAAEDFLGAAIA